MEKLLLLVICLIASPSVCLVRSETIETWGDLCNVRALDQKTAIAKWFVLKIQNRTLTFPTSGEYDAPVEAIQHINFYKKPVKTKIVDGGIGKKFVVFNILSQRSYGIDSIVTVFTKLEV